MKRAAKTGVSKITNFFSKLNARSKEKPGRAAGEESSGSSCDEPDPKRPCSVEPAISSGADVSCSTSVSEVTTVPASSDTGHHDDDDAAAAQKETLLTPSTRSSLCSASDDIIFEDDRNSGRGTQWSTAVHGPSSTATCGAEVGGDPSHQATPPPSALGPGPGGPGSSASTALPTIPHTRFIPGTAMNLPKTNGRSCQREWFGKYGWLHYVREQDSVVCFTCLKALEKGNTIASRGHGIYGEDSFLKTGFRNWKKALSKFDSHERSQYHRHSAEYLVLVLQKESVGTLLSAQCKKSQEEARKAYRVVISSIRYLARSGQALRGGEHYSGNLMELLEERAEECPDLKEWLKKRDNWLSSDIQNEILQMIAHSVMRTLLKDLDASPFYSIMADGTTDISGDEQLSVCFRYVDTAALQSYEIFMGLVSVTSGKADATKLTLDDVLLRLNIDKKRQRGHCFDGCAAMAGHLNGVQKLITDECPKSLFVHCSNHCLDLVLQELAKSCEIFGDILLLVKDVSKAILESAKRKAVYQNIVVEPCFLDDDTTASSQGMGTGPSAIRTLLSICPTRWCIRTPAMRRFDQNYDRVRATLRELLDDAGIRFTDERRATLRGHLKKLDQFSTLLSLKLVLLICEPAEQLARALQSTGYTATGAKQAAQGLRDTFNAMGEAEFNRVWADVEERNKTNDMDLDMPQAPRLRAPPRRLGEVGNRAPAEALTPRQKLRQAFIGILDRAKNELDRRFNQPGMDQLVRLEEILLPQREDLSSAKDLEKKLGIHADDFDCDLLFTQLKIAKLVVPSTVKTVKGYAAILRDMPEVSRQMINQVELLVILLLVIPATSATCERSFSALRRLKTYLRSTMTQKRLTHLMICHVHKSKTFEVHVNDILYEFISKTSERLKVFGVPPKN